MAKKPTYEELKKRVKELEKEAAERKRAEEKIKLLSNAVEGGIDGTVFIRGDQY